MCSDPISLNDLRALDAEIGERIELPQWSDPGIGCLGLILDKNLDGHRYEWCTPTNCRTFAGTGGDGVHFSLLIENEQLDDAPAVVMTNPGGGDGRSWIVGEDIRDFLCLGYYRGYFALEQLAYYPDLTLEVYTKSQWAPSESWHKSVGYTIAEHQRQVLDLMIQRFGLRPWANAEHFHELQHRYSPRLKLPTELQS